MIQLLMRVNRLLCRSILETMEADMVNIQNSNRIVSGNASYYNDVDSRLMKLEYNLTQVHFDIQLLNERIDTQESNIDANLTNTTTAHLEKTLNNALEAQDGIILTLNDTIRGLSTHAAIQNISIDINSQKLGELNNTVIDVRGSIQTQKALLQQFEADSILTNATIYNHVARIAKLETDMAVAQGIMCNHSDITEHLENIIQDQNTSIQAANEKIVQLKSDAEETRANVTELNAKMEQLDKNVTNYANIIRNITVRFNEMNINITTAGEVNQPTSDIIEELKTNLTAYNIDLSDLSKRIGDLEVKTNLSEVSFADLAERIGQLEAMQLADISLNEEQKTKLAELGEEVNQTWIVVQNISNELAGMCRSI